MRKNRNNWRRVVAFLSRSLHCFGIFVILHANFLFAAEEEEEAKGFVESIAETTYKFAWPTAAYESASIKSIQPVSGGLDVLVKLAGKSGFDSSDLWLVLVFELRNGKLNDMRVAEHNAILAAPFSTMKTMGIVVARLLEESSTASVGAASPIDRTFQGYRFELANDCGHPVRLALRYETADAEWRTAGWWNLGAHETRFLTFLDGSYASSNNSIFYYFAEAQDGSFYWSGGDHQVEFDGRVLDMIKLEDDEGDASWSVSCPGR